MKIERINENQIRCTLTSFDLSARNINLVELAYGTEKARKLFREMIQKASNDVGFEAEDIPLMVEAIPLPGESIMLVITKVEDPEELDTRFSKFSPYGEDSTDMLASQLATEFLEGAQASLEYLGASLPQGAAERAVQGTGELPAGTPAENCRIFRFESLDRAAEAAQAVAVSGQASAPFTKSRMPGSITWCSGRQAKRIWHFPVSATSWRNMPPKYRASTQTRHILKSITRY